MAFCDLASPTHQPNLLFQLSPNPNNLCSKGNPFFTSFCLYLCHSASQKFFFPLPSTFPLAPTPKKYLSCRLCIELATSSYVTPLHRYIPHEQYHSTPMTLDCTCLPWYDISRLRVGIRSYFQHHAEHFFSSGKRINKQISKPSVEINQDTMFKHVTDFGTPQAEALKVNGLDHWRIISMQHERT